LESAKLAEINRITALPVTLPNKSNLQRVSPTDISQFIRLDQCQRYLALRLKERREGLRFVYDYGVTPQAIPPLLTRSGAEFEKEVEIAVQAHFPVVNMVQGSKFNTRRPLDNQKVVHKALALKPGQVLCLFQTHLEVLVEEWQIRGDADIVRLERDSEGKLWVMVVDMKSSTSAKVEHRLQVAFYRLMLEKLFEEHGLSFAGMSTAILYRGLEGSLAEGLTKEDLRLMEEQQEAAQIYFGVSSGYLEIIKDQEAYLEAVYDLVTSPESLAIKVSQAPVEDAPYHLNYKCDSCLYNEYCMKTSAEGDDLSLLPHLNPLDKEALKRNGLTTARELAHLKVWNSKEKTLLPAAGKKELTRKLAATWPVGPRVDELIHRAKRYRQWKKEPMEAVSYIPGKGHGSLPFSGPDQNSNLVKIYIDAQQDYLTNRIYLLGALVEGNEAGIENLERRQSVVRLASGPVDNQEKEEALLLDWIQSVLREVVETAAPDVEGKPNAPVHLIFYDKLSQKALLDCLSRHLSTVLGATPLYDFMTQLAAFDSPIISFLEEEMRELKNYPMLCQSLQAVAAFLRFDWGEYRTVFKERLFDFWGKLEPSKEEGREEESPWYMRRARFGSAIPLEYAYGVWGEIPEVEAGSSDPFEPFQGVSFEQLKGFEERRLEALAHITRDFKGNKLTEKTPFNLESLSEFNQKARTLAHALSEFVMIERHTEFGAWKSTRNLPPERRVLMGETLIVRYQEGDQEPEVAARNRENEKRRLLKDQYYAAYREARPDAKQVKLPKDQKEASEWSQEGMVFRLRLEVAEVGCGLDEALGLSRLKEGERVILYPRFSYDTRLPIEERTPNTPTPKQMLYGLRAEIIRFDVERDEEGKALAAWVEAQIVPAFGGSKNNPGFTFSTASFNNLPLVEDKLYTFEGDPNDINGSWAAEVSQGLSALEDGTAGGANALYRLIGGSAGQLTTFPNQWNEAAARGQATFMAGLDALFVKGSLHGFEQGKHDYIGTLGDQPVLLVQGPPGTGKSYSTAFALFARLQGALAGGLPFRVVLSCKTHAAIDVLLENVRSVQLKLAKLFEAESAVCAAYFDRRILSAPLMRIAPRKPSKEGIVDLVKDGDKEKGEKHNVDLIIEQLYCIVGVTPGGVRGMLKAKWKDMPQWFNNPFIDCLVLDEASQMNLPEAVMAALPLKESGQLIVVGDHRQMAPIIKHDWASEPKRTFQEYKSYQSLFNTLRELNPPMIKFEESFRLHAAMAEFLREEIYSKDEINYHSNNYNLLENIAHADPFVAAALAPEHPLVVIVHSEAGSQARNLFEQRLMGPLLEALANPELYDYDMDDGLGVVVPHRAQRADLQNSYDFLTEKDPDTGAIIKSSVDTVERFQGGEREAIVVSATESDRDYLLAAGDFLYDPCRLTVALSRAKRKMILVASRSVFSLFSPGEETFANAQMWKNLLRKTCTVPLWQGQIEGEQVEVWGNESPLK
jgi:predicted RecB family nuclease